MNRKYSRTIIFGVLGLMISLAMIADILVKDEVEFIHLIYSFLILFLLIPLGVISYFEDKE